eukprot:gene7897-16167_t
MEYERALYRVYERCLEGLRDDDAENSDIGSKTCRLCEYLTLSSALFFLFSLITLHISFVGRSGCLPALLQHQIMIRNHSGIFHLRDDEILQLNVKSLLPFGYDDTGANSLFADDTNSERRNRHLRNLFNSNNTNQLKIENNNNNTISSISKNNSTSKFDFEFAYDYSVLTLPIHLRESHNFQTMNTTIGGKFCFGSQIIQSLIPFGGIDNIIVNLIMYTVNKPGVLKSAAGDIYTWTYDDLKPYSNISEWLFNKFSILLSSALAFMMLSCVTALMVRVMISSGVVLLFPLFWIAQGFGMQPLNMRIISLSYPWLGVPIELLTLSNQPFKPFVI